MIDPLKQPTFSRLSGPLEPWLTHDGFDCVSPPRPFPLLRGASQSQTAGCSGEPPWLAADQRRGHSPPWRRDAAAEMAPSWRPIARKHGRNSRS